MTDNIPKIDTYSTLEFQGIVADAPNYDRDTGKLEFVARALNRPTLKFVAFGEVAKAFKNILHKGSIVQLQASPKPHIEEVGGERCRVIEWEAKRIKALGTEKVNLGALSDLRILDGLMPMEGEYEDVGYVEPISYERRQKRIREAEEEIKRREEIDDG